VLAYCFMCNRLHLLLEVPPLEAGGLSDGGLLQRLGYLYNSWVVDEVASRTMAAERRKG